MGRNKLILLVTGMTMLSVLWSIAPDTTMRRSFALIMTTLFGIWLASRWQWRELILLIALTFGILGVLSTFMALAVPSLGVDHAVHAGGLERVVVGKECARRRDGLGRRVRLRRLAV